MGGAASSLHLIGNARQGKYIERQKVYKEMSYTQYFQIMNKIIIISWFFILKTKTIRLAVKLRLKITSNNQAI